MPITPRFKLSQTATHLTIAINIPHIRVSASSIETLVEGSDFHFHSSPYLLYLSFPGRILDDAEKSREAKATYDPSDKNGMLTVIIWKEEEGIWKDLDLLGNLVSRPESLGLPKEKIQVLSSSENESIQNDDDHIDPFREETIKSCLRPHYGFLNANHSVFTAYAREGLSHDMLEIPQPDETSSGERRDIRLDTEHSKFDSDRYLNDLFLSSDENDEMTDMIFVEAMRMGPHWETSDFVQALTSQMKKLGTDDHNSSPSSGETQSFFSEDENLRLLDNKAQIPSLSKISKEQTESLFLSLLDILYAYAYDHRTTFGDATCESSWTIVILSPTFSWLESYTPPYDTIGDVLRWSIRRCLIYPYLRNFDFASRKLVEDVSNILSGGIRVILRCLLQIQRILETSEFHYLFNKLYINSYIKWIQMVGDDAVTEFTTRVQTCIADKRVFAKNSFCLHLDQLENSAFEKFQSDNPDSSDQSSHGSSGSDSTSSSGNCSSSSDGDKHAEEDKVSSCTERNRNVLDSEIGAGNILSLQFENEEVENSSPIGNKTSSKEKKVLISEM